MIRGDIRQNTPTLPVRVPDSGDLKMFLANLLYIFFAQLINFFFGLLGKAG